MLNSGTLEGKEISPQGIVLHHTFQLLLAGCFNQILATEILGEVGHLGLV